jgi:hypothetical protein
MYEGSEGSFQAGRPVRNELSPLRGSSFLPDCLALTGDRVESWHGLHSCAGSSATEMEF